MCSHLPAASASVPAEGLRSQVRRRLRLLSTCSATRAGYAPASRTPISGRSRMTSPRSSNKRHDRSLECRAGTAPTHKGRKAARFVCHRAASRSSSHSTLTATCVSVSHSGSRTVLSCGGPHAAGPGLLTDRLVVAIAPQCGTNDIYRAARARRSKIRVAVRVSKSNMPNRA